MDGLMLMDELSRGDEQLYQQEKLAFESLRMDM